MKTYLSAAEAAEILGCHRTHVWRMARAGRLKIAAIAGDEWVYAAHHVQALKDELDQERQQAAEPVTAT